MLARSALLLALLTPHGASAQGVPDTTQPWRYFPVNVGDVWQYTVDVYYYAYCLPCTYHEERAVIGTQEAGGRTYFRIRRRSFDMPLPLPPIPAETAHLVRYDTAGATAVERELGGQEYPVDYGGCRLDEAFPSPSDSTRVITCPADQPKPWPPSTVQGGYGLPLPHGGTATQKAFRYPYGFGTHYAAYAEGIGLIEQGGLWEIESGEFRVLEYANVDGLEYGTPIVRAEPGAPASTAVSLVVRPNPVTRNGSVTVELPNRADARVTLHDVLGRVVMVLHDGPLPTGPQSIPFDGTTLPAGIYVVRMSGALTVSSRFVVLR
jgi:hypothetical protein